MILCTLVVFTLMVLYHKDFDTLDSLTFRTCVIINTNGYVRSPVFEIKVSVILRLLNTLMLRKIKTLLNLILKYCCFYK